MSVITFRSFAVVLISTMAGISVGRAGEADEFRRKDATIAEIHRAIMAGEVTAGYVVQQTFRRIELFDKSGLAISAIITTNPIAL